MDLKSVIRTVPDFPRSGVQFRDISTLLLEPEAFGYVMEKFAERLEGRDVDAIAGIESRGFIFGAALAHKLGKKFVMVRKEGKFPAETLRTEYELEYGTDAIEVHTDALGPGERVVLVDDLLATGGTAAAAIELLEKSGADVSDVLFVVNLPDLQGAGKLGREAFWLVEFEGD